MCLNMFVIRRQSNANLVTQKASNMSEVLQRCQTSQDAPSTLTTPTILSSRGHMLLSDTRGSKDALTQGTLIHHHSLSPRISYGVFGKLVHAKGFGATANKRTNLTIVQSMRARIRAMIRIGRVIMRDHASANVSKRSSLERRRLDY